MVYTSICRGKPRRQRTDKKWQCLADASSLVDTGSWKAMVLKHVYIESALQVSFIV
jgi:hypothetical protein